MQVANVRLRLNKVGSDVPKNDVTPAEAMFLHILHGPENGGLTFGEEFGKIVITGEAMVKEADAVAEVREPDFTTAAEPAIGEEGKPGYRAAQPPKLVKGKVIVEGKPAKLRPRTDAEELRRLSAKYSGARNKKNEPIINSIWPDRFNPKLPQTFKDIKWSEVGGGGNTNLEVAPLNYATGNVKA